MYRKEPIIGFEEYQVDTNGVIYSKRNQPLKPSMNHKGYMIVNLMRNGKRYGKSVHTIVAKQFLTKATYAKTQVNHKNGIKSDNRVENLEWVTPSENNQHYIAVLRPTNYRKPRRPIYAVSVTSDTILTFSSLIEAAHYFNPENPRTTSNSIYRALSKIRKTYRGFEWYYI